MGQVCERVRGHADPAQPLQDIGHGSASTSVCDRITAFVDPTRLPQAVCHDEAFMSLGSSKRSSGGLPVLSPTPSLLDIADAACPGDATSLVGDRQPLLRAATVQEAATGAAAPIGMGSLISWPVPAGPPTVHRPPRPAEAVDEVAAAPVAGRRQDARGDAQAPYAEAARNACDDDVGASESIAGSPTADAAQPAVANSHGVEGGVVGEAAATPAGLGDSTVSSNEAGETFYTARGFVGRTFESAKSVSPQEFGGRAAMDDEAEAADTASHEDDLTDTDGRDGEDGEEEGEEEEEDNDW